MPRKVTANELRWLGEEADGRRDEDYVVVWRSHGATETLGLGDPNNLRVGETKAESLDVRTELEGPGLLGDAKIQLLYNGEAIDVSGADSIFITQSAFAKFVIPYYTRFRSPAQIAAMKVKYFQDGYIGVAHFPPSIEWGVAPEEPEETPPRNLKFVSRHGVIGRPS